MINNMRSNQLELLSVKKIIATFVAIIQIAIGILSILAMEDTLSPQQIVMTTLVFGSAIALLLCWRWHSISGFSSIIISVSIIVASLFLNYNELSLSLSFIGALIIAAPSMVAGVLLLMDFGRRDQDIYPYRTISRSTILSLLILGLVILAIISSVGVSPDGGGWGRG